jgi:hypothetical protein
MIDALAATFRVAGDQAVLLGAGAVHPTQAPRDPQPVSSKPATPPSAMRSRTTSENSSRPSAARMVILATVPSETGVPNSSANAWAVRFLGQELPDVEVEDDRGDLGPVPQGRLVLAILVAILLESGGPVE